MSLQAVLLIEKQVRMFLQRTRYKKLLRIAVTSALAIIQVPSLDSHYSYLTKYINQMVLEIQLPPKLPTCCLEQTSRRFCGTVDLLKPFDL